MTREISQCLIFYRLNTSLPVNLGVRFNLHVAITRINTRVSAIGSTTVAENGIGNASSQLQMQITRDELNSTFTCKVNSTALVEPLTVDIKLDVHGEYSCVCVCVLTFPIHTTRRHCPLKSESLKADKRSFIDVSIDESRPKIISANLNSPGSCIRLSGHLSSVKLLESGDEHEVLSKGCEIRSPCVFLGFPFLSCVQVVRLFPLKLNARSPPAFAKDRIVPSILKLNLFSLLESFSRCVLPFVREI